MSRSVSHEITLIAYTLSTNGMRYDIYDIVETSNHHASRFVSRWSRNPEVMAIGTCKPGASWRTVNQYPIDHVEA